MHRNISFSSRALRVCVLGLATISAAVVFTTDTADARRRHRGHHARHHVERNAYNPAFASIIVDGNTGAVLTANNPDSLRHPASLTKIMTLYLLFERLEQGKLSLDSEMEVSDFASGQAPTKLGLRPGQTLRVEDAIKGLVTRSANDAAVVIAETIAGSESDFAKMMTRKARALGMSRTVYRNASGLPNNEQVTTARDQSILGRAIQDRFPRYYRYFSTSVFTYRGQAIRNHNRLLGNVEGVDGIKTGYTRASGFNLVTSMHRGNRFLVGVVLGGRSGGSRDAIMRNLLAENLEKGATRRTVAAITERSSGSDDTEVAETNRSAPAVQVQGAVQVASAAPEAVLPTPRPAAPLTRSAAPEQRAETKPEPGPFNSGTIETKPLVIIPGSAEPMKPVRVKTVQVKSAPIKLASAVAAPPVTSAIPPARRDPAETSNAAIARVEARPESIPQPAGHGTGQGVLGVLPASSLPSKNSQALAYAEPAAAPPPSVQQQGAIKTVNHTGWIVQVGALESETEARKRLEAAREHASGLLGKADPFTETVTTKGDRKLYRARFAGLERDEAEAVCRKLKRSDISCFTIKN
ncbi:D-alanyl-D-alanine carboxypeptidase [Rhodopseudomonas thermotolerans]|uniref:D-alanyl-D-alanine carboxypeptidase n=2 Tax=Rhodopseudomonas TaxID=1073 RepID=A0A336JP56_9BRAD|nr:MULTISPECIES: serine hydrolase [Rhodopseudomonas]RED32632.1 D-alanyl-D-alanine carboxypeptidase [Rhodopseudomonas pentothenatexigens]REF93641.1 D-alanyl-D-alanine carboxypeptidase [Rhodopseudomonas thermotolerans]SSW91527.1 D-alanyl-D-alanine carboxypeptidase [Rhodopseudomonas pentothenatexigens]